MAIRSIFTIFICVLFIACNSDEEYRILSSDLDSNIDQLKSSFIPVPEIYDVWFSSGVYSVTCSKSFDFVQIQYSWEGTSDWQFYTISQWDDYKHPTYNSSITLESKRLPRGDFKIRIRYITSNNTYSDWSEPKNMPHNYSGFFPELPNLQIPDDGHAKSLLTVNVIFPPSTTSGTISVEISGDCSGQASSPIFSGETNAHFELLVDTDYEFNLEVKIPSATGTYRTKKLEHCIVSAVRQTMQVDFRYN